MELNFDKEMDALLRQTARQETGALPAPADSAASASVGHLDVDELAAFSANALPVKARARAMEHLVDCGNCRTILSNLVFFEHQEEEKPAAFAAIAPVVKEASLVERILGVFKFPTLAYGMAGLVLVFTAVIAFVVLRGNSGAELAQLSPQMNKAAAADAAPSQYPAVLNEAPMPMNSNASANSAGIASAANSATTGGVFTMPSSTTSGYASNSNSTVAPTGGPKDVGGRLDDSETKSETRIKTGKESDEDKKLNDSPPPPAAKSIFRQEETQPQLAKPQTNIDQVTRGQDNYRSNNNIMTPDGGSDKDRKRAVSGEAGANMTREGLRDEKEKQAQTEATAPENKNEPKKAAGKKPKKKTAAADASAQPSPSPSPAKTPEKKPEEKDPCR